MCAANDDRKTVQGMVFAEVLCPHVRDSNLCSPFFAAAVSENGQLGGVLCS